ncbi:MAG: HugZ family protein [Rhodospirillaceae bacterium]
MKEIPKIKPSESHRQQVRGLLRGQSKGSLATAMAEGGAPYASMVSMATDQGGAPLFLFSTLSDHTRNLQADPRAALLVEDLDSDAPSLQQRPRATVMGRIEPVTDPADDQAVRSRFLARHPSAALYAGFGDFGVWRMVPERVHWVGGFARAVWIPDGCQLAPEAAAGFADAEAGVLAHMNADHGDAVQAYASGLAGLSAEPETGAWQMTACDADGFDLTTGSAEAAVVKRIAFDAPLSSAEGLRKELVVLAKRAREAISPTDQTAAE